MHLSYPAARVFRTYSCCIYVKRPISVCSCLLRLLVVFPIFPPSASHFLPLLFTFMEPSTERRFDLPDDGRLSAPGRVTALLAGRISPLLAMASYEVFTAVNEISNSIAAGENTFRSQHVTYASSQHFALIPFSITAGLSSFTSISENFSDLRLDSSSFEGRYAYVEHSIKMKETSIPPTLRGSDKSENFHKSFKMKQLRAHLHQLSLNLVFRRLSSVSPRKLNSFPEI